MGLAVPQWQQGDDLSSMKGKARAWRRCRGGGANTSAPLQVRNRPAKRGPGGAAGAAEQRHRPSHVQARACRPWT